MKTLSFILFSCLFYWGMAIQTESIDLSANPPLQLELRYSGTFSELRPNHFHGGVDLKTQGREGQPVYAIAEGHIRRIKVGTGGYGKVIYIDHGDSYTSVYGHLSQFSPRIQSYIKSEQYASKSYEIERYFSNERFRIAKGEVIGYSGNTGNSFGPHLHFEVREQKGQIPLNPLNFGLKAVDYDPPTLLGLYVYEGDTASTDDLKFNRKKIVLHPVSEAQQTEFVSDTLEVAPFIGIGVEAFDRLEQSLNKNGLYQVDLSVKDSSLVSLTFDRFSFEASPRINKVIDYEFKQESNKDVQLLFKPNDLSIEMYKKTVSQGIIELDSIPLKAVVSLKDHSGNETKATLFFKSSGIVSSLKRAKYSAAIDTTLQSTSSTIRVRSKKNAMISSEELSIALKGDTLSIGPDYGYLQEPVEVSYSFSDAALERVINERLYLGKLSEKGKIGYIAKAKDSVFEVSLNTPGQYLMASDTIPPVVAPMNFQTDQNLNNFRYLSINVEDQETFISRYNGYIDDQWVLFEYEPKEDLLRFDLNDIILLEGKHTIRIEVEDALGNKTDWSTEIDIR